MALLNPYCTVAQVQDEIDNDDSGLSGQIEQAINHASRVIDRHKRRDFFLHDYTSAPLQLSNFDDAVFGNQLFLPYAPVITLTQVEECGDVLTLNEDYVIKNGILWRLSADWSIGEPPDDVIKLTGKFGYDQASSAAVPTGIPLDITQACILIAAAFSGNNKKEIIGLDGNKEEVIDKKIPKTAMDLLGSPGILI